MLQLALAAILIVGTPDIAHAQSLPERMGLNSFLGISPSTDDFLNQAALNEMFEDELRKLAEAKGTAKTKRFAAAMLKDHREISTDLKSMVRGGLVAFSYPQSLDQSRQEQLEDLQKLDGVEFDKRFESIQTTLHERTVSLFERYANAGDHPDLKRYAHRHLPNLREHWRMAKELK